MPMKEWFRRLQPVQLYVILTLTVIFFIAELAVSHLTHAITLLMDSYHTLCNIFALLTCIITVKYGIRNGKTRQNPPSEDKSSTDVSLTCERAESTPTSGGSQENKLKNTFGWARIDVIGLLICCVLLASFSFSIVIEAVQTLVHIDHHDEMHHAIPVFSVGITGLVLNGICYFLIGGYTFHQGSFLYMNEEGCVVLNRVVTNDSVSRGERRLSRTRTVPPSQYRQRQGFREMLRDVVGCIFVIICAVLVYFAEPNMAKFIDPLISIVSAAVLMILSFPYMKESCLILLQTIPDTINIESLRSQLLEHFPDIVNVHDLHIWQLTATKVISTAHIIFKNPHVYGSIMSSVTDFFQEYGITQVTIQPEFFAKNDSAENIESVELRCLMHCQSEGCKTSHCCPEEVSPINKIKCQSKEQLSKKTVKIEAEETTNKNDELKSSESNNSIEHLK
ncbi:hypothetical protein RN001_003900 [Aquatica leii]|uniref:Zinc transporter 1 n=1 Tax=Aquatica leii TaxID=1421715 RepID=A0AAN7Q6R1_9COLE|nr:hypothetical protein RN001_003900 [Aquatica leii]